MACLVLQKYHKCSTAVTSAGLISFMSGLMNLNSVWKELVTCWVMLYIDWASSDITRKMFGDFLGQPAGYGKYFVVF